MLPIRLTFALFGMFWGTWAVSAFDIQRFLGLSESQLGLLVAATVAGTTVSNVIGGTLAERRGAQRAIVIALAVWGPLVVVVALLPTPGPWMVGFLAVVAAGGLLDVIVNIASAGMLVGRPGRLLQVHASYNGGAVVGAAVAGLALAVDDDLWRLPWALVGGSAVVLAVVVARRPGWVPAVTTGDHVTLRDAASELRRSGLLRLAVVFTFGAAVEGGIGTFGVLYLRDRLDVAVLAGAGAYVAGQGLATITRSVLGRTDQRVAGTRAAKAGLLLAATGLALEAATDIPAVAAIGLAVAAIGVATYWPLLSAVANGASDRPGLAVGGVSAAGYLGFLLGPVVVGAVADGFGLR
nr:MFS transporter [Acidimicrobiia bacterium]